MKINTHKNGAWTTFERNPVNGFYTAKVYAASGALLDKIICDTYREAREYLRAFDRVAKNS